MPTNSSQKTRAAKRIQMTYRKKRNRNVDLSDMIFNSDYIELERALQNGANPNRIIGSDNKYFSIEYTYLCMAVAYADMKAVEILLKYGAKPNHNSNKIYPINFWDVDIFADRNMLILKIIEMLLLSGADPNIIDYVDNTPLLYALELDGYARGFDNYSYLHSYGRGIITLLLKYGADPRKKNNSGLNALMEIDEIVSKGPKYGFGLDAGLRLQQLLYDKANILDEMDRLALSQRRLALSRGMEDKNSMFKHLIEPQLMENISAYLSSINQGI